MPASHCPDFDPRGHTNMKCSSSPEVKPKVLKNKKTAKAVATAAEGYKMAPELLTKVTRI